MFLRDFQKSLVKNIMNWIPLIITPAPGLAWDAMLKLTGSGIGIAEMMLINCKCLWKEGFEVEIQMHFVVSPRQTTSIIKEFEGR